MPLLENSVLSGFCVVWSDLHVEGLFRVPGNSVRQQTLKELLNSGADVDLHSGDFHPNDVATLLKTFLGELPEPLLTHRHFNAHLKIAGTDAGRRRAFSPHHMFQELRPFLQT